MEPFSALAVATGVVTFVEFSSKLISGSRKLYRSTDGRTDEHDDLRHITQTLSAQSQELQRLQATDSTSQQSHDLRTLCQDAQRVAAELIQVLDSIQLEQEGTRWQSCLSALKSRWKEDHIEELQRRIDGFRQQLTLNIVVILREEVYSSRSDVGGRLESVLKTLQAHIQENRQWGKDLIQIIREQYTNDLNYDSSIFSRSNLGELGLQVQADEFARHILRCLDYKERQDRHDRISDRYRETFEWIYRTDTPEGTEGIGATWDNFSEWLESRSQLYWISGKAGAGKTTLMKLLHDDPRTDRLLSESMDHGIPVVRAGFFFWNSGASVEMSQHGLVQSLLRQIVAQCQDIAPSAFPDRWETFSLLGLPPNEDLTWTELLRAFLRLIEQVGPSKRFFFLIDGLDEYQGEKQQLIVFLEKLLTLPNCRVKMCVSSRLWPVFEDAFAKRPSLHIHELTLPDMRHFITSSFGKNAGYLALKAEDPEYATKLTEDIAQKASGVFLWVSLVVDLLLAGLSNGDNMNDLEKRLESIPPDLEGFFQKILDSQEPAHREHASQLFQIFRASSGEIQSPLQVLTFAFADEDADAILEATIAPLDPEKLEAKIDRFRRRLNSRCKGLLEVPKRHLSAFSTVEYLHRTVKDFIEDEDTWEKIKNTAPKSFDPNLSLTLSYLMLMKTNIADNIGELEALMKGFVRHLSECRSDTSMNVRIKALDQLDTTLVYLTFKSSKNGKSMMTTLADTHLGVRPHWTHIDQIVDGWPKHRPRDFLNYVVAFGFVWYLESKLPSWNPMDRDDRLVPLLLDAAYVYNTAPSSNLRKLLPYPYLSERDISYARGLDMMRFLLDNGADFGEIFEGSTILDHVANAPKHKIKPGALEELNEFAILHGQSPAKESHKTKSKRASLSLFNRTMTFAETSYKYQSQLNHAYLGPRDQNVEDDEKSGRS
ncbi:hypothetical protein BU16DRAFT_542947 [Lophium mytilinum]|uniref:NACHT domain-containing protein n=1 Tax=Lophium mytilinum TaxID=390894 RepID=A0A6A6QIN8_9PEZI|nr:hypothetical protein BU16DRAFT_542947 [Lophium mytilinum]